MRPYGFQVYIFLIHDLYIALCAHHPKSDHLLSPLPFTVLPTPCAPVTTMLLSVSEFWFYIPHTSEIIWSLAFPDWLILPSAVVLRFIHVVANVGVPSFPVAVVYMSHIFFTKSFIEGRLGCVRVLAAVNNAAMIGFSDSLQSLTVHCIWKRNELLGNLEVVVSLL